MERGCTIIISDLPPILNLRVVGLGIYSNIAWSTSKSENTKQWACEWVGQIRGKPRGGFVKLGANQGVGGGGRGVVDHNIKHKKNQNGW